MQVTQAKSRKSKRADVEDFKIHSTLYCNNMKKFIKSKIDHNETANRASPTVTPDLNPPPNICKNESDKSEAQPPLPLDPPPPDKLPNLNLTLKKEIEDMEYQNTGEGSEAVNQQELGDKYKSAKPMCRDFIRGKCTRPGTCKFSHKCDISQLVGVYTFCRNFQNTVCTLPNCKYVHATVFEEQHFYRTAVLPPHAIAHHKKVNIVPPPPPPSDEIPTSIPTNFNNPPPPLPRRVEKSTAVISCIPASKMESRTFVDDLRGVPLSTVGASTLKREMANIDIFGCSPRDLEAGEQLPNKCKSCDFMEFRLHYNKDRVEKMKQTSKELSNKLSRLNQKNEKLYALLISLLKPAFPTKPSNTGSTLNTAPNIAGDRDKSMLEQLHNLLNASRLSGHENDNN